MTGNRFWKVYNNSVGSYERTASDSRTARRTHRQAAAGQGLRARRFSVHERWHRLAGTAPSQDVIENCDTLLMVGTSYPYMEYPPKLGECKCVQIDSNPQRIGLRYPAETGLWVTAKRRYGSLFPCRSGMAIVASWTAPNAT